MYVDDCLAVIPSGTVRELNNHLNTIDDTGSIKFTYEEMDKDSIPFLDALLIRRSDGTIKSTLYRKSTHTNQYLLFESMHPLTHKLSVVRTLLDRCHSIVTDEQDRLTEEETIQTALGKCGYPSWTKTKVKKQRVIPTVKNKRKKDNNTEKKIGQVVLPYVKGTSERISRMLNNHRIGTSYRPHTTLRRMLVHPKDKIKRRLVG